MAKAATRAPQKGGYGGMESAQGQMAGGGRYPYVKLDDGDITRFHFLTNGDDLIGSKFHKTGTGRDTRYYICLRVLTGGQEQCKFCEEGHDDMVSRFAVWVFVHNTLHAAQTEDDWKATKVGKKTLFREEVKEPRLLKMAGGRKGVWFSQVTNYWTKHGDLQLHIYELRREGLALDTEYYFDDKKASAIPPAVLKQDDVKALPTIEEVLREELTYGPAASGSGAAMGTDEVLGGGDKPAEEAAEETPAAEAAEDDNLI